MAKSLRQLNNERLFVCGFDPAGGSSFTVVGMIESRDGEYEYMTLPENWYENYLREERLRKEQAVVDVLDCCIKLQELGIAKVTVAYDGSGDSGETYAPKAYDADDKEVDLPKELEDHLYAALDAVIPAGYENNDGGEGEVILDVAEKKVFNSHTTYYTESNVENFVFDALSPQGRGLADDEEMPEP